MIIKPAHVTAAKWTLIIAALALALCWAAWAITEPGRQKALAEQAKAGQVVSEGQTRAATQASEIIDRASTRQAHTEETARKNADAIRSAPGGDVLIDRNLADVGRRGLCQYSASNGDPACLR